MRSDRPLILSVILLAAGLWLTFGYCHGTAGMSAAYPFAGSSLHLQLATYGPAAVGGPLVTLVGLLVMAWALLCAIMAQFGLTGGEEDRATGTTRLLE
ncbi:MAG TPA: hypothetical protein VFU55_05325 [Terracidiphilus sp.]|nr:hypothetical protein [Terracidiphilus sp.]